MKYLVMLGVLLTLNVYATDDYYDYIHNNDNLDAYSYEVNQTDSESEPIQRDEQIRQSEEDKDSVNSIANILIGAHHDELADYKKAEDLSNFFIKNDVIQIELRMNSTTHVIASNTFRYGGGNERHIGQTVYELETEVSYYNTENKLQGATLYVKYMNKDSLLDFNEKPRQNFHNQHYFRADGFFNDVELYSGVAFKWKVSQEGKIVLSFGGVREEVKALAENNFYLAGPIAYEQTKRIDTGIQFKYWHGDINNPTVFTSLTVLDGDRTLGDTKLNVTFDSRANSYPGYVLKAEYFPTNHSKFVKEYLGNVGIETMFNAVDIGSHPGQKRQVNDQIVRIKYHKDFKGKRIELSGAKVRSERNIIGNGNGKHSPSVITDSTIYEAGITGVKMFKGKVDFHFTKEELEKSGAHDDGEYWNFGGHVNEMDTKAYQIRYHNPFGILANSKVSFSIDFAYKQFKSEQDFPHITTKAQAIENSRGSKASMGNISINIGF